MEMRTFKENIECVEKHLEFIYENLNEISEKISTLAPDFLDTINKLRGYILLYYRTIQELKISLNHLESNYNEEVFSYIYNKLDNVRANLRTIRKILHNIKNTIIDREYEKLFKNTEPGKIKDALINYHYPLEIASLLEEIMDNRGNLYAAERHLTEFLTALQNKFKK